MRVLEDIARQPFAAREQSPLPNALPARAGAGGPDAWGLEATPALVAARAAALNGDGERVLAELARESESGLSVLARWLRATLKAEALIALVRPAEVETAIASAERLERQQFGTGAFADLLRAEFAVARGMTDQALDLLAAALATRSGFRMPADFEAPPRDSAALVHAASLHARGHAALALLDLQHDNVTGALFWAARAEALFADRHDLAAHPVHGIYLPAMAESYRHRARNLAVLGAARLALGDGEGGTRDLERALGFFDREDLILDATRAIALRAWGHLEAGETAEAIRHANAAVARALQAGIADLIWRVHVLHGEALLAASRTRQAEAAFRIADASVDAVAGDLALDRMPSRFGVGKSDLARRLARFARLRGDLPALYAALERGRARRFVDLLAGLPPTGGAAGTIVDRIAAIDRAIRTRRLTATVGTQSGAATDLDPLLRERDGLLGRLVERDPDAADALRVATLSLAQIRDGLPADTVLIYALPTRQDEAPQVLAITREGAELVEGLGNAVTLEAELGKWVEAARDNRRSLQEKTLTALRGLLAVADWPERPTVLLVPEGNLQSLPWGALLPDATVALLATGQAALRRRPPIRGPALVLGDPVLGNDVPRTAEARAEALETARRYGVNALVDRGATETALRQFSDAGLALLYLGAPCRLDATRPLASSVMLSGAGGSADPLSAAELFADPLRADLVVLPDCAGGPADDSQALVRAFLAGGARHLLRSQRRLGPREKRAFLEHFHDALATTDAARAWRLARDRSRKDGLAPAVYGAFVLHGAPQR